MPGLRKPQSIKQRKTCCVAWIDIGGDCGNWIMRKEPVNDHGESLMGQSFAPMVGVKDEADLGEAPASRLADHLAFMLQNKIHALGGRCVNHQAEPIMRLVDRPVGRSRPVAHCSR